MLTPNTILQNRYLILRLLGKGGMGAVYLAQDQRLGNLLALKETLFPDVMLRKQFEREARLLAKLRHPALPVVSDHFTEEGGQFLVMQFIAGDDVEAILKSRGHPFSDDKVLAWADQLLDALDYLHTQEPPIIHRDIKPQNLKLTNRGHIVLLDFGLAKGIATGMSRVTSNESIFGFSQSFAPLEQMQGTGTDQRSDIFSLGVTLYYLLTGVMPPDALNRATVVLSKQPDPLRPANEVASQVRPAIAAVLMQAMALDRNDRPTTAAEMRLGLQAALQTFPIENTSLTDSKVSTIVLSLLPATGQKHENAIALKPKRTDPLVPIPEKQRRSRRWLYLIAGCLVLAIIGLVVYIIHSASIVKPNLPIANSNKSGTGRAEQAANKDDPVGIQLDESMATDNQWKHSLQAMGSTNEGEANSFAERLVAAGIPAYVVRAGLGSHGTWYRVRIGRFTTPEEAQRFAAEARSRARAAGIMLKDLQVTNYDKP